MDKMTDSRAVEVLATHNEWRRGGDGPQTDPATLGLAIDHAIARLREPAEAQAQGGGEVVATPAARWREAGEPDPHGRLYDCERAKLSGGDMSDDEVANAMLLDPSIVNLTIAKDRIRWLSRRLSAPPSAPVEVEDLIRRIDAAIERVTSGRCTMRVPADPTDPDLVLADAGNWIQRHALAQQPAAVDGALELVRDIAEQAPEKPDHWNSCSQCEHNIDRAQEVLAAQPGGSDNE